MKTNNDGTVECMASAILSPRGNEDGMSRYKHTLQAAMAVVPPGDFLNELTSYLYYDMGNDVDREAAAEKKDEHISYLLTRLRDIKQCLELASRHLGDNTDALETIEPKDLIDARKLVDRAKWISDGY